MRRTLRVLKNYMLLQEKLIESQREVIESTTKIVVIQTELVENYKQQIVLSPKTHGPSMKTVARHAKKGLENVTVCAYCGGNGDPHRGPDGKFWHIDHIYPKSLGGSNDLENIVKACCTCNISKGARYKAPIVGTLTAAGTVVGLKQNETLEKEL